MIRVINNKINKKKKKRILNKTKGYFGNKSRLYKYAKTALFRSSHFAYIDRRKKKSNMRRLWITKINLSCKNENIKYSHFIYGLKLLNVKINKKIISDIATLNIKVFSQLISMVKNIINQKKLSLK